MCGNAYLKLYSKSLPLVQSEFHSQITVVKVDIDVITVLNGKVNLQNVNMNLTETRTITSADKLN